ncbi:MAG TPA: IPT/TIG domain-containing protein [Candidatus Acidoferrum sp.]|nr:IPT/TIG domain-containing protein [Candidatus Acidoferrum sp.]
MRNPFSNSQMSSWMKQALEKLRAAAQRGSSVSGQSGFMTGGMKVLFVCVLLVGAIAAAKIVRQRSIKNDARAVPVTIPAPKIESVAVDTKAPTKKPGATASRKVAAQPKIESITIAQTKTEPAAPVIQPSPARTIPVPSVIMGPPVGLEAASQGEKEGADLVKLRGSWFFDQRAYPNKHIPEGAFQKAIQQRDAMREQQRSSSNSKAQGGVADSVQITFPGDALWHLMGPQPVNNPFGANGGFPTASGRVTAIAIDPTTPSTIYIGGAAGGVWKSTDSGTTWTPLTDNQPSLAIGSIAIDPNSCSPAPCTTIYVGTGEENFNGDAFYGAGILKSVNAGASWTQVGASTFAQVLGPDTGGAYIGSIAVQPGNSSVVLAAVSFFVNGTIGGIYRSADGGNTWTEDASPQGLAATSVLFESTKVASPTGATAWAAMGNPFGEAVNGIYKSTDSGQTWTLQGGGAPSGTTLGRVTLGYAPSTSAGSATLYAAVASASTSSSDLLNIYKTVNGGTSWTTVTGPASGFCDHQCFYDMAIGVHPTNSSVVVLGGAAYTDNFTSLFESQDGGNTWTPSSNVNGPIAGNFANGSTTTHVHVDTHAIVFNPAGSILFVGDDGGMWSTNTPTPAAGVSPTWSDLNAGLAITQSYPGATAGLVDENTGFMGTQDNDTEFFDNSLEWTSEQICGDGGFTAIDETTPSTIYAGCNRTAGTKVMKAVYDGQFITFNNGGQTFQGFDRAETAISASGDAMQFIPPLAIDGTDPDFLYFGTCRVWMTSNAESSLANTFVPLTPTWTPISGDLSINNEAVTPSCPATTPQAGQGNITNLEVAHSNSAIVVAGTSNGKVWETLDATAGAASTWTEIDAGALPNRTVTAVRTKRNDSTGAIVYVTFSGFDCGGTCGGTTTAGHVFKTTTAGTTNTWINITGDLPDIPVNDIIVDHESNPGHDALYIATDAGVFSCPNPEAASPCANWTVIGDGLPNSPVLGLAMRRNSRILRAHTHGRSAWEIQLTDVNPPALAAISSITPAAVNVGAATTTVTIMGVNFSANTQVQWLGSTTGVTTTFVNTTQLTVTLNSSLFTVGDVFPVSLTDPAGVDSGSVFPGGGAPFAVMNPLVYPTSMTPSSALTYTAVPFHLISNYATEPFLPNTILAFYDTTNTNLLLQLPQVGVGTVSSGGTVYDYTTPITTFTTPGTYNVVPYNPPPGGLIDAYAVTNAGVGGKVPFAFTVTANPGPVIQVSSPLSLSVNAVGANTGTTYNVYQVSNLVGATLSITNATITGTNAANFVFIAPGSAPSCNFESTKTASIIGGSFCFFGLEYTAGTPPGNAQSVATLNIFDNITGSPQAFPITGNISPTAGLVFLSSVNFGAVALGTTSPTMNATLTNLGTSPVNVTAASITGANSADFQKVSFVSNGDGNSACPSLPFALPAPPTAGYSCDVSLTFTPSMLPAGAESAELNVTASVAVTTVTPNLTGTGVQITSISPSIVQTGGPAFTLTVVGGGFAPSAVVNDGPNGTNPRLTTYVSPTELLASIPASDIATAGSLPISVTTPNPGGTPSEPKTLIVAEAFSATNDDINFATSITATPFRMAQDTTQDTPNTGGINDPTTSCGSNSVARSVWFSFKAPATGKVAADTRYSTYTTILSAWTGTIGSLTAVACNTGGITGVSPAESFITFNVTSGTTYYLMVTDASGGAGGTLTFSLDFAAPPTPTNDPFSGATNITSTPYATTENTILATANTGGPLDPVPSCAPAGAASGGAANSVWFSYTPTSSGTITADTLTSPYDTILTVVTGSPGAFTQIACNDNATVGGTLVFQSQVSFLATSGMQYFFMVSSVLGDGGTTNFHLTFTAAASNPAPTLTSISPTSTTAGTGVTLTLTGTNFIASSTVNFGANVLVPTTQTSTSLQVTVPAADVATAGSVNVTVTNPAPGGGTTTAQTFTVNNLAPTLTSINPTSTIAGTGVTMTLTGTNFIATSTVNFGANVLVPTSQTATSLQVTVPAADVATAGPINVTVTNPAPGGGTTGAQTFTVNNPAPTISSLNPNGVTAGSGALTLTVNGTGFVSNSAVKFNNNPRTTTFVSSTEVTASILASDVASTGSFPVTVTNAAPGGGTSNSVNFTVSSAPNPVPTLTSISPTTTTALGPSFTMTLTGTNFIASSTVNFGANPPLVPTSQTATSLQVTVPAADITVGGTVNVTVTNPAPGGGTTSAQSFTIDNPPTTLTSFSPSSATAGGPAFTLTINGSNFVNGATGTFNGNVRTVNYVSSAQVTMLVTAPDIATAGSPPVVVSNPAPAGGTNGALLFTVNNVVPTLTSISPTSATVGGPGFTLTLTGTNFVSGSTVKFGTVAPAATFVSSTQLTAAVPAVAIITAGPLNVSVSNPAPGGGTSGTQTFNVNNPVPTLTSISPTSTTVGTGVTMTLTGTNFVSGSTVNFGANVLNPSSQSATSLQVTVPAADVATAGPINVTVTNPGPGGGTTTAQTFTVNNAAPTLTSINPTSTTTGTGVTMTLTGTNFVSGSTVNFGANVLVPTSQTAISLQVTVPAADVATAGPINVTVTNPAPGGGTSTAQTFTVNNVAPTLSSINPTSTTAGTGVTMTLTGTNFVSGSTVNFGANVLVPTTQTATSLQVTVPAADVATAGAINVTVKNPAPGGGTSSAQTFTVNNPVPTITSLNPNGVTAGGAAFTLTVTGTNFVSGSTVNFGANPPLVPTSQTATQLQVTVPASDIATAGSANVTVTNPAPGGGTSTILVFNISSAPNPVPTLTSISPTSTTVGTGVTMTLTGTNFVASSTVNFGANVLTPTSQTSTQLVVTVPAGDVAATGTVNVTVTNPAPGGGTTSVQIFNISNPVPTLASISPTSTTVGTGVTLTLTGTNFVTNSTVNFGANVLVPTSQTATSLQVSVPAADVAAVGTVNVTVTNPAPGGGTTPAQAFSINNPAPTLTSISPTSTTLGTGVTLTLTGTNFLAGSTVNFGANVLVPTTQTATSLQVTVPAADVATAGPINVTVTNPAPGGGTSSAQTFTVNNPAPTLTSISPTNTTVGTGVTLTLTGTNFVSGSTVNFGANVLVPTTQTATSLQVTVPVADVATAGPINVTVTNPAPGGGTSSAQTFTVNNLAPTLTSISPTSTTVGTGVTLTLTGTNFVATSTVNFGANVLVPTSQTATSLQVTVPAADVGTTGTVNVTVTNPAPGGGTSTAQTFSVNNPVPTLTSISPTTTTVGTGVTLTLTGTNFVSGATVNFGANVLVPATQTATSLQVNVPAADVATAGTVNVTVKNPTPGGGTSSAQTFTVNNPAPVLASLSPSSGNVAGPAFTLTVTGTGFISGATVQFNGANRTTVFGSATSVTASILASDLSTAGTFKVTVTNPTPTVGPSNQLSFTVDNPVPTVGSVNSAGQTHVPGGAAFTLTVNGTNFVSSSVVNFSVGTAASKAETTTFVSGTQITASISANDVATAGTANVTVTNPSPGGGTTAANTTFTIDGYTVSGPSTPPSVKAGQQAMITITVTPSANGFANAVNFAVSGLPNHSTGTFTSASVTPGTKAATTTLTVTTTANSELPPGGPVDPPSAPVQRLLPILWLAALLVGAYSMKLTRRVPQLRRYAALVPLALLLITGAVMAGCAGHMNGTPKGTYQLTVTGTSGTLQQTGNVQLTVD